MKYYFDNISKEKIIEYILPLARKLRKAKISINISRGTLNHTDGDRVGIKTHTCYSNLPIENLTHEDLVIVLRYLQNYNKCRDIVIKDMKYGEMFNVREKKFEKFPCNKDEVRKKIKEYLKRKKNIASTQGLTETASKYLKNRLQAIKTKFCKNADCCYSYKEDSFIIILDRYEESEFGINLLHLISDMMIKFKKNCYVLDTRDFVINGIDKTQRLMYI